MEGFRPHEDVVVVQVRPLHRDSIKNIAGLLDLPS